MLSELVLVRIKKLIGWVRDRSQVDAPTTWMSANISATLPSLQNQDLNDGLFHSCQVLFIPNQSITAGRECWVHGFIDGEYGNEPKPFPITTGIIAGTAPAGTGYDCLPFFCPRHTVPSTPTNGFKGQVKNVQVWKFSSVPDDIDLIIRDLNREPRQVPLRLKERTV